MLSTTQEKLEILVIEDNENHLADARKAMDSLADRVTSKFARDYLEAMKHLTTNPKGVVSDIFFPTEPHTLQGLYDLIVKSSPIPDTYDSDKPRIQRLIEKMKNESPAYIKNRGASGNMCLKVLKKN